MYISSIYTATCHACIHQYTCSTGPFACYIYYPYTTRPAWTYLPVRDGPFACYIYYRYTPRPAGTLPSSWRWPLCLLYILPVHTPPCWDLPSSWRCPFACYIYYPYTPRPARTYLPVGDGPFALASLGLAGRLDDHQASLFFHLLRDFRQVFLGWPHHLDGVHLLELQQLVPGKTPLQHHHDLSPLWKESVLERGQHFTYLRSIFMSHLYVTNCIS